MKDELIVKFLIKTFKINKQNLYYSINCFFGVPKVRLYALSFSD